MTARATEIRIAMQSVPAYSPEWMKLNAELMRILAPRKR